MRRASKKPPEPSGGDLTVRQAGKRGGEVLLKKYGSEYFRKIGQAGGRATRDRHGAEFYGDIGKKGGEVVRDKYGPKFYEKIGHKGGQKIKRLIKKGHKVEEAQSTD